MDLSSLSAHLLRAVVLIIFIAVGAIITFLTGLSGRPLGWLWASMALAAVAATVGVMLWWGRPGRGPVVAAAVGFAVVAGAAVGATSPPDPTSLGNALDDVQLPDDARLVEETVGGGPLCFELCTTVSRDYYMPPTDRREVAEQMRDALREAGYELDDPSDPYAFGTRLDDRSLYITGRVDPRPAPPTSPAQPSVAPVRRSGLTIQLTASIG